MTTNRSAAKQALWSARRRLLSGLADGKLRSVGAYALGPVLGLLSGPVLARALGPEGRGQFAAVMQPLAVAGAVASIGVPAAVAYFVAKGSAPKWTFRQGVVISALPAAAVYGTMAWYSGEVERLQAVDRQLLLVAWLAIFASAVVQIRRGMLQGAAQWRVLDIERVLFACLRFGAVAVVAVVGFRTAEVFVAASLAAFVVAAASLWLPHSVPDQMDCRSTPSRAIIKYSLSASIGSIAVIANNRLDQVLFPLAGSSRQLGYYAIAVTVAEVPLIMGTLSARNVLTAVGRGASVSSALRDTRFFSSVAVVASLMLALTSRWIVPIVFGDDFAPAVMAVVLLCFGTIFACAALCATAALNGLGRPKLGSVVPATGLMVTGIGFVLQWGDMSSSTAAGIAAISQLASAVLGALLIWRCERSASDQAPPVKTDGDRV